MFVIITGATATGKSAAAVELAKRIGGEIVSADSMQVYRGMDIGTFKITGKEMSGIPHHMIDIIDPGSPYSAAQYKAQAEKVLDGIKARGRVPILAGGTGLYIHAIIRGIMKAEEPSEGLKASIRRELAEKGLSSLALTLKEKDPEGAASMDLKNSRRVVRALELIEANGAALSVLKARTAETRYRDDYRMFVLELKRSELYRRIDARTGEMIKKGLINEVKSLINKGVNTGNAAVQAIGYGEIMDYLELMLRGGPGDIDGVAAEIKQATRNFAKRQVTWFKKYREAERVDVTGMEPAQIAEAISQKLKVKS